MIMMMMKLSNNAYKKNLIMLKYFTYLLNLGNLDIKDWVLPRRSAPWKSCNRQGWISRVLRFWNDGRDQIIHAREIAGAVLRSV